jgi:hypothetical protein
MSERERYQDDMIRTKGLSREFTSEDRRVVSVKGKNLVSGKIQHDRLEHCSA